jgi:hypothetical protein
VTIELCLSPNFEWRSDVKINPILQVVQNSLKISIEDVLKPENSLFVQPLQLENRRISSHLL